MDGAQRRNRDNATLPLPCLLSGLFSYLPVSFLSLLLPPCVFPSFFPSLLPYVSATFAPFLCPQCQVPCFLSFESASFLCEVTSLVFFTLCLTFFFSVYRLPWFPFSSSLPSPFPPSYLPSSPILSPSISLIHLPSLLYFPSMPSSPSTLIAHLVSLHFSYSPSFLFHFAFLSLPAFLPAAFSSLFTLPCLSPLSLSDTFYLSRSFHWTLHFPFSSALYLFSHDKSLISLFTTYDNDLPKSILTSEHQRIYCFSPL